MTLSAPKAPSSALTIRPAGITFCHFSSASVENGIECILDVLLDAVCKQMGQDSNPDCLEPCS
jgi:hypothetical protein